MLRKPERLSDVTAGPRRSARRSRSSQARARRSSPAPASTSTADTTPDSHEPYTENVMKIGIIGAGGVAQAVAKQALGADYEVVLSNSRGPETLKTVAQGLGAGPAAGHR